MTDITIDRSVAKQAERDAAVVRKLKSTSAVVLLLLAATSFAAGVPGLLDAGRWARLGEMAWLTPIAIDGGLVFFSASAMAWRAETAKASALGWTMVWLLSAVSVAAQIAHVLGDNANPTVQDFVGAGVASMFPLLVLASTRQFEMLRFSRVTGRTECTPALERHQADKEAVACRFEEARQGHVRDAPRRRPQCFDRRERDGASGKYSGHCLELASSGDGTGRPDPHCERRFVDVG